MFQLGFAWQTQGIRRATWQAQEIMRVAKAWAGVGGVKEAGKNAWHVAIAAIVIWDDEVDACHYHPEIL